MAAEPDKTTTPGGRSLQLTQVTEWLDGHSQRVSDALAVEEPLEMRVNAGDSDSPAADWPLAVTMRTPGHDDELTAGFLLTEGIVESAAQIVRLEPFANNAAGKGNGIRVVLRKCEVSPDQLRRNFFAASSCGICGKASIEAIRVRGLRAPNPAFRVSPELLCTLPEKLREQQRVFASTGGLHAAALFTATGELLVLREDIGRHNAVDKVIGWAALREKVLPQSESNLSLRESVLVVSGRGGFEIVQKALAAGVPVVASVSAPSSLAVQLARELGLTLVGFLRGRRFVVYAHGERCGLA